MSGVNLGLAIDGIVAVLLIVTIAYCTLLNRRLKNFRGDEAAMRATIAELVQASEIAERAIGGLKATAAECDKTLTYKLRQADRYCRDIEAQIESGQALFDRVAQISKLAHETGSVQQRAPQLRAVDRVEGRAA